MKKTILLFSTIIIILLLTACNSKSGNDIKFKEDTKHQVSSNFTYKFIGESEHFYFETGKVYYNNDERELLISNFKVKNNIDKNARYSISLYFNDILLYGGISNELLSKKEFENTIIGEHGYIGKKDQNGITIGESDSFLETTKENFKESIKLKAKYCIKNKCEEETFKIKYVS